MSRDRVLVTGANGFVGQHLCRHLAAAGREVTACVRPKASMAWASNLPNLRTMRVDDFATDEHWADLLSDVDAVIHLAARVHVMRDQAADPLGEFRRVNVESTAALAEEAGRKGVRRFIYLSSIKVNGEMTTRAAFQADDAPGFCDPYGQSKWEAEQKLQDIAGRSGMEWVVVRPTLVYGPGVRGNFLSLLRYVDRRYPLPFGRIANRRSVVSVYNLVDLLQIVLDHPSAAGQRFLVKDPEDISTSELVQRIAKSLHKRPVLLCLPRSLVTIAAKLLGREAVVQRLFGSLTVNIDKTVNLLDWHPPISLDEALATTCCWYKNAASTRRG